MKYNDFKIFRQIYFVIGILKCCITVEDECTYSIKFLKLAVKIATEAIHCTSI